MSRRNGQATRERVVLLSGNPLCNNPRVQKEAASLARHGYEVEVLGGWPNADSKRLDLELLRGASFTYRAVVDGSDSGAAARLSRFGRRVVGRLSAVVYRRLDLENRLQLGSAGNLLCRAAASTNAKLIIAHSEVGMVAAADRLRRGGSAVGVDMEDWFSEDLLPEARKSRPLRLLRTLEHDLLRRGAYSTCPSRVMSAALAERYDCRPPAVVYNAFLWSDRRAMDGQRRDRRGRSCISLHWYSQTLGQGRGLEDLLGALPRVKVPLEIHLRGQMNRGFERWFRQEIPVDWRDRVFLHDPVPSTELLSRIAEHDIGFAAEGKFCRSRDLTVTNKILHYLLGGLAVVASDTAGQGEVAEAAPGAIATYRSAEGADLAESLNRVAGSLETLRAAKAAALRAAETTFSWERQEPALLEAVEQAIEPDSRKLGS